MFTNKLTKLFVASISFCALSIANAEEEKVLNIYNWNDYIDPTIITDFEKETGIKVVYDLFDSNEVLEAKLLSGKSGYDIVVPGSDFLAHQIKAGVFQKLNKESIPNLKYLEPKTMAKLAALDPDNAYAIPYTQGSTGIGYNVGKIKQIFGDDYVVDSWDLIFKPENLSKMKDCGVAVLNAPTEIIATAMHYLGLPNQPMDIKAYAPAEELLMKMRENVTYFHSSQYINDMANGDICLSIGWSGDMLQAASRAEEANNGVHLDYVVPKEGALIFFDMLAIPADADHPDNAHLFINYILQPKVMAKIASYTSYANVVPESIPFVTEKVRNNKNIFLPQEIQDKSFMNNVLPMKVNKAINKIWSKVRSGE